MAAILRDIAKKLFYQQFPQTFTEINLVVN